MSGGGLGCLKKGALQQFRRSNDLPNDYIECLHLDNDGTLWIGTFGGGLSRLKQGRFTNIAKNQGLPGNVICDIEDDGRGFYWMSSHGGIIRVSKTELNRCADGQIRGVALCDLWPRATVSRRWNVRRDGSCQTADGRLWFPTTKGLVNLDPENVTVNQLPPPVVIEAMLVDDQLVAEGAAAGTPLTIPPGPHRFEFQYTGPSFTAPQKVQFKYRLTGFETEWVDAGSRRVGKLQPHSARQILLSSHRFQQRRHLERNGREHHLQGVAVFLANPVVPHSGVDHGGCRQRRTGRGSACGGGCGAKLNCSERQRDIRTRARPHCQRHSR